MPRFSQQIRGAWVNLKNDVLPRDVMEKAAQAMGVRAREMNIERLQAGRNRNGSPMAAYTAAYARKRRKMGLSSNVDLRVKGELYRAIAYRVRGVRQRGASVDIDVELYVRPGQEKKVKGLSTGRLGKRAKRPPRDVVGIYDPGVSEGRKQRAELVKIQRDIIRANARARGVILTENK